MSAVKMWIVSIMLTAVLACTVAEGPGDAVPGREQPVERPRVETPRDDPASPTLSPEAEARARELATEAGLAYEAGRLEEALRLSQEVLRDYAGAAATGSARWIAARAAFGLERYRDAAELAEAYAAAQPDGSVAEAEARGLAELARDALASPDDAPALIGALVPRSGSRVLVRYGDWVLEGIRLAIQQAEARQARPIELVVADDGGGTRTREAVMELERRGVVAIAGPLLPQQLALAAGARVNQDLLLVSPTIPETDGIWPGTYSVGSGDTRGAQELGRFAAEAGFRQAALLYPRSEEYERKARAFAVEFEALGGEVRASVPYDSGTTTFEPHMEQILAAVAARPSYDTLAGAPTGGEPVGASGVVTQQPFALFVAAPEQDVRLIAPQVAFYGLDAAGAQVFGDAAWTSAAVRRVVPVQDLQGVIAASPFPPGEFAGLADSTFIRSYERVYRKSLDNQLPALGYDAANLVLQALPSRLMTPSAVARRFRFLTAIPGATGLFSVRAQQVVRTPFLVMIQDAGLVPAPSPWEYSLPQATAPGGGGGGGGGR